LSRSGSKPDSNHLLADLPRAERERFIGACEPVELTSASVLAEPRKPVLHAWFPTGSIIVRTVPMDSRNSLEVGLIGNEGMLGVSLVLGVEVASFHAVVQGPGPALRMGVASLRRELEHCPALTRRLQSYLHVILGQIAQTAACTRFHVIEARLARWLLMTRDRAHSSDFRITHEFLAHVLGVRRVGVTRAATSLQDKALIGYSRGNISILDHHGLEAASCQCYATDKATYARMLA
jgi:CRP-like cAMP-binding protein